ncbi:hypothetical protein Tco_1557166 [Tanacetum coccineum]
MTMVKRVIVKHASEFTARINTMRLPSAVLKKMAGNQKKQPRIRFAVRTPPVNCKPVKKVLPCTSSVGSNDPDVILLDVDNHDEEEEELSAMEEDGILAPMDQSLYLDYNGYINS